MYDSCKCKDQDNANREECWYAKTGYNVIFLTKDPFDLPAYPRDTTIIKHWTELDTNLSALREKFQFIENKYGSFVLKKGLPDIIDTASLGSRSYRIMFSKHQYVPDILVDLTDTSLFAPVSFQPRFGQNLGTVVDFVEENNLFLFPNPANDKLILDISNISYSLKNIKLYNLLGTLFNVNYTIFTNDIEFDITSLNKGIYFIQIDNKKAIFIKM